MRSITKRTAIVTVALALAYVQLPTPSDGDRGGSPQARVSNGRSLNGQSLDGRIYDERAKGRLAGNGSSLQGETSPTTGATPQGGMSVLSIKLPPTPQPERGCSRCR